MTCSVDEVDESNKQSPLLFYIHYCVLVLMEYNTRIKKLERMFEERKCFLYFVNFSPLV